MESGGQHDARNTSILGGKWSQRQDSTCKACLLQVGSWPWGACIPYLAQLTFPACMRRKQLGSMACLAGKSCARTEIRWASSFPLSLCLASQCKWIQVMLLQSAISSAPIHSQRLMAVNDVLHVQACIASISRAKGCL